MGSKRRRHQNQPEKDRKSMSPMEIDLSDPNSLPQRLSTPLTLLVILALYGWMASWSNWFLYSYLTTHLQDNFRVLIAFYGLLGTIRFSVIMSNLRDIVWACAIFTSAFALGRTVLDSLSVDVGDDWGRHFRALATGLGLLSLALLFLGLIGLWTTPIMMTLVLLPLLIAAIKYRGRIAAGFQTDDFQTWLSGFTLWEYLGFALLASYLLMNLMGALGPEYFYDSLVYHLAMPKLYLLHHRIVPTPSMIYSGIPFATEMLYGLGLALGTESLAKLIHYGFGLATAAAIYSWCLRRVDRKVALLATLLFYSAPMVCFESSVATVELSMTFYLLLAAFLILEETQKEAADQDPKWMILSGALAGFAVGTKYNAGLYMPVLALPLVYQSVRSGKVGLNALLKQLTLFFGSAALVFSPWPIKDWLFYHNPVYPFLHDFFKGSPIANVDGLKADAHARAIGLAFTTWAGFKDILIGVWDPVAHRVDSYIGPSLEIGLPWLLLVRWKSAAQRGLMIVLAGLWLAWALHTALPRFMLPAIPVFCILVASALCLIELPRPARFLFIGIFCYAITISLARTFLMLSESGTWKAAYGRITKSDYLLHEHPSYNAPYYAGAKYINENLPQDATVLFIGEERGYYCERKFITASVFDVNPMADSADSAADTDDLLASLKRKGITHLLVNAGSQHYQQWLGSLRRESREKYENLLTHKAQLIFDYNKQDVPNDRSWVQVYKLGS